MRKLYTAFKGSHNTSFQLVNQINGDKLFLTNSFQGLEKDILSLRTDYDAIYMLGIDKNLKNSIRIETCANYNGDFAPKAQFFTWAIAQTSLRLAATSLLKHLLIYDVI